MYLFKFTYSYYLIHIFVFTYIQENANTYISKYN